ncbi:MAG: nucleotidyltransferase domain-containing protein [Sulfolobales archaeon]
MGFKSLDDVCEPYKGLLSRLLDVMRARLGERLVSVVLYGSVARCEARRDSDVDLLIVVKDPGRSRLRRQEMFMEIEESLEEDLKGLEAMGYYVDFSPIIKSPEEASKITPLYLDMAYDAVILYDRDGFMQSILERLRRRLEELGAERVRVGKLWYWRLKKDYRFGEVIEIE